MKRGVVIILTMIFLGTQTIGQTIDPLAFFAHPVNSDNTSTAISKSDLFFLSAENLERQEILEYQDDLKAFIEKMVNKRDKTKGQTYFLKYLFYRVHDKYLKNYENFMTFGDLFENGNYDCVSGSALYTLILDQLGFEFSVYESNFHVLLLIKDGNELVLFESTDFSAGFVNNEEQIMERIAYYKSLNKETDEDYYTYENNTDRIIDSKQLAGLLFYNLAVQEFNQQNFSVASTYLNKAELFYKGSRISELRNLISKMTLAANSLGMQ